MSNFVRLMLFALFTAAGVGVAICVATTAAPASSALPDAQRSEVATPSAKPSSASAARHAQPAAEPNEAADSRAASQHAEPAATMRQPRFIAAQPPVAAQAGALPTGVPDASDPEAFLRWAGTMMQTINQRNQAAETAPQTAPQTPPAAAAPVVAEAVPSPLPAPSKTTITQAPGEGDDQLSITIQGEDIRRVLELLSEQGGLNILASNNVTGTVTASLKDVNIATALDAILKSTGYIWRREGQFIYVGTPADFSQMRQAADHIGTRLYRPNYVRAADLQTLVTPLLTEGVGTISVTTAAEIGIAPNGNEAGGDGFAGQEALLVRDYEAVLAQVDQIIAKIDCRPTQVAIEAMVLSVALKDDSTIGVDFEVLRNKGNIRVASGTPLQTVGQLDFKDGGLKVGFLDSSLASFVTALETIGDTNVIATPRLMCLNKHRAEILIGQQLGYVSTTQTETSTTQSVEFLEVGTQLRIRPFISSDGMVRMEVHPELSTGTVRIEGGFTLPNKELTQVTTNVMVHDGHTVIIGGLLRDEVTNNQTQIPWLGSAPVVGPLFRRKVEKIERREILVLLTPRIVYEPGARHEGQQAAAEFIHRHNEFSDQMSVLSRTYIGRKYFRAAQESWAAGNGAEALRLVNLSLHYNPSSRAALSLRSDVVSGVPVGDHTGHAPYDEGETLLEGEQVPPWLLEQLGGPAPIAPSVPIAPSPPSAPGDFKTRQPVQVVEPPQ